jgi:hypothetical protein
MEYKNEIVAMRSGGLGSSDAAMVFRASRSRLMSETDKKRIGVMLGLEERREFSTPAMQLGDKIENQLFSILQKSVEGILSNPLYVSERLSKEFGFQVFNHIDYEYIQGDSLVWIEHKSTLSTTAECQKEYKEQLAWHAMLLKEKAESLGLKPVLKLSHYNTTDYNDVFDANKLDIVSLNLEVYSKEEEIKKGLQVIKEVAAEFSPADIEETTESQLPTETQMFLQQYIQLKKRRAELDETIKQDERRIALIFEMNRFKSIATEAGKITYIPEGTSVSFDKARFESEHPEFIGLYDKSSVRKPSVRLTLKK